MAKRCGHDVPRNAFRHLNAMTAAASGVNLAHCLFRNRERYGTAPEITYIGVCRLIHLVFSWVPMIHLFSRFRFHESASKV